MAASCAAPSAGVYESELERIGNVYMLRDEPPHRLHTLTTETIMASQAVGAGATCPNLPRTLTLPWPPVFLP